MTSNDFSNALRELYDGELLGEAFFECMLGQFHNSEQSRKPVSYTHLRAHET